MKTLQFMLFAAVCVIFVHADPVVNTSSRTKRSYPCNSCSPWTDMTADEWYASKGHPQPVANRSAPGYQNLRGLGTYKVHRTGRTWSNALAICASEGSLLVVIDDYFEAEAITNLIIGMSLNGRSQIASSGMHHYWIGAREYGINNQFFTLNGERLGSNSYLDWCPSKRQPHNYGNYDCVGIMQDQHNFASYCNALNGFVCEKVT